MLEPIGTLIFLMTLWLAFKVAVELLDDSGGRILSALLLRPAPGTMQTARIAVRVSRRREAMPAPRTVRMQWRDAA
ncbi:hypothetical protein H8M03_02405 [Sphingomonas sabuli]|uniref:Uncharacterized protein n=1 Tax=Sphingomonas sabuli TaxID=2764186 RepID=A0A7G9L3M3_9SPHN|nr:hypothetical protein [Sphingomonas sabuli]QNM83222.1 hypothetical protein H8M03_02405 [Sphingomonas sabuli]